MGQGRTIWDFATEHRWFRWTVFVGSVGVVLLLLAAGVRLNLDEVPFLKQTGRPVWGGVAGASLEDQSSVAKINDAIDKVSTSEVAIGGEDAFVAPSSGEFLLLAQLNLDFQGQSPGETTPYMKCELLSGGERLALNRLFGISCQLQAVAKLAKGDAVVLKAGHASGRKRQVSGQFHAIRLGE